MKKLKQFVAGKMLQSLINQMDKSTDPSVFADPLAEKTAWTPLQSGGASFQTHTLIHTQADRVEFRSSVGMLFFSLLFMVVGAVLSLVTFFIEEQPFPFILIGLVFFGAGCVMLYSSKIPVVFDKRKNFFWKGRKTPTPGENWRERKNCVRLGEIYAVQVLAELVSGKNNSYYSYEINLILKDSSRLNVVDHGDKEKAQEDAQELADFLGKPLWDASEMNIFDSSRLEEVLKKAAKSPELLDEEGRKKLEELKRRVGKLKAQ